MAYEVAAIYDKPVKQIDLSHNESGEDLNKSFTVKVNTDNCIFIARKALNVTIKESPDFIKNRLISSGIRPINNVVDISNYVMLECGQPLHFYDADRLGNIIETRMAISGEKLTTLDGIERDLEETDIVISDGTRAIGLAGVMGGLDTEIEEIVKNSKRNKLVFGGEFAYIYFLNRYNLEYATAYQGCGEGAEPSAKQIKEIIDTINNEKIPIIFYQELSEGKIAKMIADETNIETLIFHTAHNVTSSELENGVTYISIMRENLENIKRALN